MRFGVRAAAVPAFAALALAGLSAPADAAAGSLTVTAIDRAGHAAQAQVHVINLATNSEYQLTTGHRHVLANGRYGVGIVISPGGVTPGGDQTLGGAIATVRGRNTTIRFDARQGRLFTVTPNAANPLYYFTEADICAGGSILGAMAGYYGFNGMQNYVIPSPDRALQFGSGTSWMQSPAGPYYFVTKTIPHGVPSHPSYSYAHGPFAKLVIKVLRGTVKSRATSLMVGPTTFHCSPGGTTASNFNAPRTVTAFVSTGDWSPYIIYSGNPFEGLTPGPIRRYVAGQTYRFTLNRT